MIALQQLILKLLAPFIGAMDQRRAVQEKAAKAASLDAARQARISRLKSRTAKKPTAAASDGDEE